MKWYPKQEEKICISYVTRYTNYDGKWNEKMMKDEIRKCEKNMEKRRMNQNYVEISIKHRHEWNSDKDEKHTYKNY